MKKEKKILDPADGNMPCNYISLDMDYPRSKGGIESFLWYIYHRNIEVIIGHDGEWYIVVKGKCSKLSGTRCLASSDQPENCLMHGEKPRSLNDVAKFRFTTEIDLLLYLREHRPALFKKLNPATQKAARNGNGPSLQKNKKVIVKSRDTADVLDETHDCSKCDKCCTYLNITVDKPTSVKDVKNLLWYVYHENCDLNLDEDGGWSVVFHNRCDMLDRHGLCSVYERRPSICSQFSSNNCHGLDFGNSVKEFFPTGKKLISYFSRKRGALFKKFTPQMKKLAE
ncbi:MAG: YkgJ family cysteine cluster protein [Nitrospinota bacterium]|nr:YkgJ family cysteine cluster protein [Nitrospinota bacterium]